MNGNPYTEVLADGNSLTLNVSGTFVYKIISPFNSSDVFSYTTTDGLLNSAPATITFNVHDKAPVANADTYNLTNDGSVQSTFLNEDAAHGVLANDTPGGGNPIHVTQANGMALVGGFEVLATSRGNTVTLNSDGSFAYHDLHTNAGPDSFSYTISDGILTFTTTATINIHDVVIPTILDIGGVPVGTNGSEAENTSGQSWDVHLAPSALPEVYKYFVQIPPTLANANPFSFSVDNVSILPGLTTSSPTTTTTLHVTQNAGFDESFSGELSFTVGVIHIGGPGQALQTFTIDITDPDFNPTATLTPTNSPIVTGQSNVAVATILQAHPNGDDVYNSIYQVLDGKNQPVSNPFTLSNGNLVMNSVPTPGTYSYNIIFSDSEGDHSQPVQFSLTATDSIAANPDNYSLTQDGSLASTFLNVNAANGVLANDTPGGGNPIQVTQADGTALVGGSEVITTSLHNTVTLNSDGSFTYQDIRIGHGTDSFSYTISDGISTSTATANVIITDAFVPKIISIGGLPVGTNGTEVENTTGQSWDIQIASTALTEHYKYAIILDPSEYGPGGGLLQVSLDNSSIAYDAPSHGWVSNTLGTSPTLHITQTQPFEEGTYNLFTVTAIYLGSEQGSTSQAFAVNVTDPDFDPTATLTPTNSPIVTGQSNVAVATILQAHPNGDDVYNSIYQVLDGNNQVVTNPFTMSNGNLVMSSVPSPGIHSYNIIFADSEGDHSQPVSLAVNVHDFPPNVIQDSYTYTFDNNNLGADGINTLHFTVSPDPDNQSIGLVADPGTSISGVLGNDIPGGGGQFRIFKMLDYDISHHPSSSFVPNGGSAIGFTQDGSFISMNSDGSFSFALTPVPLFNPNGLWNVSETFQYLATDGLVLSNTTSVTLNFVDHLTPVISNISGPQSETTGTSGEQWTVTLGSTIIPETYALTLSDPNDFSIDPTGINTWTITQNNSLPVGNLNLDLSVKNLQSGLSTSQSIPITVNPATVFSSGEDAVTINGDGTVTITEQNGVVLDQPITVPIGDTLNTGPGDKTITLPNDGFTSLFTLVLGGNPGDTDTVNAIGNGSFQNVKIVDGAGDNEINITEPQISGNTFVGYAQNGLPDGVKAWDGGGGGALFNNTFIIQNEHQLISLTADQTYDNLFDFEGSGGATITIAAGSINVANEFKFPINLQNSNNQAITGLGSTSITGFNVMKGADYFDFTGVTPNSMSLLKSLVTLSDDGSNHIMLNMHQTINGSSIGTIDLKDVPYVDSFGHPAILTGTPHQAIIDYIPEVQQANFNIAISSTQSHTYSTSNHIINNQTFTGNVSSQTVNWVNSTFTVGQQYGINLEPYFQVDTTIDSQNHFTWSLSGSPDWSIQDITALQLVPDPIDVALYDVTSINDEHLLVGTPTSANPVDLTLTLTDSYGVIVKETIHLTPFSSIFTNGDDIVVFNNDGTTVTEYEHNGSFLNPAITQSLSSFNPGSPPSYNTGTGGDNITLPDAGLLGGTAAQHALLTIGGSNNDNDWIFAGNGYSPDTGLGTFQYTDLTLGAGNDVVEINEINFSNNVVKSTAGLDTITINSTTATSNSTFIAGNMAISTQTLSVNHAQNCTFDLGVGESIITLMNSLGNNIIDISNPFSSSDSITGFLTGNGVLLNPPDTLNLSSTQAANLSSITFTENSSGLHMNIGTGTLTFTDIHFDPTLHHASLINVSGNLYTVIIV